MKVKKAFRFRLYPNASQRATLAQQFGCSRYVYNYFLAERKAHYARTGSGLSYQDTARMLTELKSTPDLKWLREANSQSLQQALKDLERAFVNFFEGRAAYPKFKKKHRCRDSFRVPQFFSFEGEGKHQHLKLPKMTPIRVTVHRPIEGKLKQVTISRTASGKYFASVVCEVEMPKPQTVGGEIGLDLGLNEFAVTSRGEHIPHPHHLRKAQKRLAFLQRRLSRRVKGSAGREKARLAVARQHERVANCRRDLLHKLSRELVRENQAIHLEHLNVRGMLANHRLAQSIADSGWGEFVRQLKYKGAWYGCDVTQADTFFPSSKTCSACGHVLPHLLLGVREWSCPACGARHDRDENAAINLLNYGRAGTALTLTPVESVTRSSIPEAPPLAVG